MKKLYPLFVSFLVLLLPSQVLAAVDISLKDNSTVSLKSISLSVDSNNETLESFKVGIKTSSGVEITEVNTGTIACDSLEYLDESNVLEISCSLENPTVMNGVLANILFTSSNKTYGFEIMDDDTLEIGELVLGEVENIEGEDIATTMEEDDDALLVSSQEESSGDETSGLSMDNLSDYLPYVLIAGSAILLISIIGILLSKKKEPKVEVSTESVEETQGNPLDTPPTDLNNIADAVNTAPMKAEPTLQEMVNQGGEVPVVAETPVESVPEVPTVDMSQKLDTPLANTGEESNDLQEIMQKEQEQPVPVNQPSASVESIPVMEPSMVDTTPVVEATPMPDMNIPMVDIGTPEAVIPTQEPISTPEQLQESINAQISQLGDLPSVEETPVQPTVTEDQQPSTEELPPVPPMM